MEKDELLPLIDRAAQRDQKAQTKLINAYWVDVFYFILQKVGNETTADELTVSVFSKVLSKLDLYDANFQFKTWILTIAQNSVIDYWRKKSRENEEFVEDLAQVKNLFARSPEELMISQEDQKQIAAAIESLDAQYRDIIRMRFFEEKSIREISEELHLSISNTKVRIMRAKKVLAQMLKHNDLDGVE